MASRKRSTPPGQQTQSQPDLDRTGEPGPKATNKARRARGLVEPYFSNSSGLWRIQVEVGEPGGPRRRATVSAPTKEGVLAKRTEFIKSVRGLGAGPSESDPGAATVRDALARFLLERRPRVGDSTYVSYLGHGRLLAGLHDVPLPGLTAKRIREFMPELVCDRRGEATANKVLITLRMALKLAVSDGLIPSNPASLVARLKHEKEEAKAFEADEVAIIRAYHGSGTRARDWADIVAVLFGTGLRVGEALGLRARDVIAAEHMLSINGAIRRISPESRASGTRSLKRVLPKTKAGIRKLSPAEFAWDVLVRRAGEAATPTELLFHTASGRPHSPRNFNRAWYRMLETLGDRVQHLPPHSARHTVASQMLAAGLTLDDVKRYLGHSSIAHTSDLYGHFVVGRSREIGQALGRALDGEAHEIEPASITAPAPCRGRPGGANGRSGGRRPRGAARRRGRSRLGQPRTTTRSRSTDGSAGDTNR